MSAVCFSLRALLRSTLLFIVFGSLSLAHAQTRALTYAGVNLSGAEYASSKKPGVLNKDYMYPATNDYTY
ncbi:cellulase, partial [Xanthomonas euvesicatoria]